MKEPAMLYLCATPIGNLMDLTPRVAEAFASCDAIYCEDTRRTLQLINHLRLSKPLISCHAHNERARAAEVVARLQAGETIVYASDAGMPGISDPGAALAAACIQAGLDFTVLPGASAVLTAVVFSGLPAQPFTFFGFFPREPKPQREVLAAMAGLGHLAILYESPQRIIRTLTLLLEHLGDCPAALLRELTKKYEQAVRGSLSELLHALNGAAPRGECVIAVYVPPRKQAPDPQALDALLTQLLAQGLSVRDAAAQAAEALGAPKKEAYSRALALKSL